MKSLPDDRFSVYTLKPFQTEPFLYRRLFDRRASTARVFSYSAILPLLVMVLTIIQGTFSFPRHFGGIAVDVPRWLFGHQGSPGLNDKSSSISLLRDYPSVIGLAGFVASIPLVYYLFLQLSLLYGSLYTNGCITVLKEREYLELQDKLNEGFEKWGRHRWMHMGLCLAAVCVLYVCFGSHANLARWRPSSASSSWNHDVVRQWWGTWHHFNPSAILWVLIGTAALYSGAMQTYVGHRWSKFLSDTNELVAFLPNPSDPDGQYGWHRLRGIMAGIFFGSLPLGTMVGFAIFTVLRNIVGIRAAAVVLVFSTLNVATILQRISRNLRANISRTKRVKILELDAILHTFPAQSTMSLGDIAARAELRSEIERYARLPTLPVARQTIVLSVVVSVIPLVAAMLTLIATLSR